MLRTLDEKFGIGMYTRYMLDALLKLDHDHTYILFYRNAKHLGKYASHNNVEETVVNMPNKLLWDQLAIPLAARRARVDVLFHTKFTVPFLTKSRTAMRLAGASWFVHPEMYPNKLDLLYIRLVMPFYCRRADAIIANSDVTTNDFVNILHVPREKITTVYNGVDPRFRLIHNQSKLDNVRQKYDLPDRFILTVGRYDPRKNFATTFAAFTQSREAGRTKLVAVGADSWKFKDDYRIDESRFADAVLFPGYIGHDDLPAVYNMARLFLYPSTYEEFPNPCVEAMACGCPVVAANTGAIPEATDGAGLLADPNDALTMAKNIDRLTSDEKLRHSLIKKGLERAKDFTYEANARKTLEILEKITAGA